MAKVGRLTVVLEVISESVCSKNIRKTISNGSNLKRVS